MPTAPLEQYIGCKEDATAKHALGAWKAGGGEYGAVKGRTRHRSEGFEDAILA